MYVSRLIRVSYLIALGLTVVDCAINLDGSPAVVPVSVDDTEAAPIDGLDRYWPEQHDCPIACSDYSNIHSWIPYIGTGRLQRCTQPMLLQFSVFQSLDTSPSSTFIRACTREAPHPGVANSDAAVIPQIENPKLSSDLIDPGLERAAACKMDGTLANGTVLVSNVGIGVVDDVGIPQLVEGMGLYFSAHDNCDESFVFAYHGDIVASAFVGPGLSRRTMISVLQSLSRHVRTNGSPTESTIAQICDGSQDPEHVLGIAINMRGDLAAVQRLARAWHEGKCAPARNAFPLVGAEVWHVTENANNRTMDRSFNSTLVSFPNTTSRPYWGNGSVSAFLAGNSTLPGIRLLSSMTSRLRSMVLASTTTSSGVLSPSTLGTEITRHSSSNSTSMPSNNRNDTTWKMNLTASLSASHTETSKLSESSASRSIAVTGIVFKSVTSPHPTSSHRPEARPSDDSRNKNALETIDNGTLSCRGLFFVTSSEERRLHNGTLTCNGTISHDEKLVCSGQVSIAFSSQPISENGTLLCNGTLHSNGTIRNGEPVFCNGTFAALPIATQISPQHDMYCNGTLHSNISIPHQTLSDQPRRTLGARQAGSVCATHLIQNGDTCFALASRYGVKVEDIESWNTKTWGWQGCADLLIGYNMCVGSGSPPMPAPQQGTQCGPLVPGTRPPTDPSISLADLNPCPLKACCSNWGFCGVFPAHCTINAPAGAAPGAKNKNAANTCVSNCGTDIKQNSGPPAIPFGRIGYYSAFAYGRKCLHLPASSANTDGTYTIIHWAFAEIDPSTWRVVINDPGKQWQDFKALQGVKRIVSFGGWAYSTEPATYNIIRQAILVNYEIFTSNIAQFVQDEGLDGVDIDWEYPGAPDILVDGQPIGHRNDGRLYLRFLRVLRSKLSMGKLMAIAAPASYWYLKAFPIDTMATVLDYIVYMTYDLHGQWDFGNPNAFDNCDSGKCIRSHVNLTETRNALGMVTKAGVPTNKIFVGEASYGRTFRMAQAGCWGEMCEFTGSRAQSDATPGRCTNTGGYLAMAEIAEILMHGGDIQTFHDPRSNTDVLLYNGDYVSYMTTTTKDTRRANWRRLNFAGSIDWALDLQSFSAVDAEPPSDIPEAGQEGCTRGEDLSEYTGTLCEFTCSLGFCPVSFCECTATGPVRPRPRVTGAGAVVRALDESNAILNQLCTFAYRYGFFPEEYCQVIGEDAPEETPQPEQPGESAQPGRHLHSECLSFKDIEQRDTSIAHCLDFCSAAVAKAREEGRTTNYGCLALTDRNGLIPWSYADGSGLGEMAPGRCLCDNFLINEIVDSVIEALPIIAQIGCAVLMSSLKFVLDLALAAFPPGRLLHSGLDMLLTAAQMINFVYPESEDPAGAFSWWLSPCGGGDLLPEEFRQAFDIMSLIGEGASSFTRPRNVSPGSGRKGDNGNPHDQPTPRAPGGNGGNQPGGNRRGCRTPMVYPGVRQYVNGGAHVVSRRTCGRDGVWTTNFYTAHSVNYPANGREVTSTGTCGNGGSGPACLHYSSAIRVRPGYATITCPQAQAATAPSRRASPAVARWYLEHDGLDWKDQAHRAYQGSEGCEVDEYPPAYLLGPDNIRLPNAQLVRFIPADANNAGGRIFKGWCLRGGLEQLSNDEMERRIKQSGTSAISRNPSTVVTRWGAQIDVDHVPVFTMGTWQHQNLPNDGLDANQCYPSGIAPNDPGFALLDSDPYNVGRMRPYNYRQPYQPGVNGV